MREQCLDDGNQSNKRVPPPTPSAPRKGSRRRRPRAPQPTRHTRDTWNQQQKTAEFKRLLASGVSRAEATRLVYGG
jgi:hypothetical protein